MPELSEHDGALVDGANARLYLWQAVSKAHARADEADALRQAAVATGASKLVVRQIELLSSTNRHLASSLALIAHTRWDQHRLRRRSLVGRFLLRVLAWLEEV